jgi:hypothetical protein
LGLKRYAPVRTSTIPCPPEVPGKNACKRALESAKILSINIGLPARSTVINGIVLSSSRICVITSSSNLPHYKSKDVFCFCGI